MSTPFHVDPDGEIPDEVAEKISRTIVREKAKRSRNQMPVWLAVAIIALCIGGAVVIFTNPVSYDPSGPYTTVVPGVGTPATMTRSRPTVDIAATATANKLALSSLVTCEQQAIPSDGFMVLSTASSGLIRTSLNHKDLCRLTPDDEPADYPSISPDGALIAFRAIHDSEETIEVIDARGLNRRQVIGQLQYVRRIEWSSDSTQLVYQANGSTRSPDIFRVNVDGSQPVNLTESTWYDVSPAWTRDGNIVYLSAAQGDGYQLALMKPDGTPLKTPLESCDLHYRPDYLDASPVTGQAAFIFIGMIFVMHSSDNSCVFPIQTSGGDIMQVISTQTDSLYYMTKNPSNGEYVMYGSSDRGTIGYTLRFTLGAAFDVWMDK